MKRGFSLKKTLLLLALLAFVAQTAACGYFLYPERRGQTGGKVDAAVAIMDGACLLLFIIPGVIAYAVDLSSGAIYVPGSAKSEKSDAGPRILSVDPENLSLARIESAVYSESGIYADLNSAEVVSLAPGTPEQRIMAMAEMAGPAR